MTTFKSSAKKFLEDMPTRTENGMRAYATSKSKVLDFFGKAGSSRGTDLTKSFFAAFNEDADLAIRTLLWTRDVRGGAGERGQFRTILASIEKDNAEVAGVIMSKIPEIGRWDDLFVYKNAVNRKKAFEMIETALKDGNGLAAKWMPRKGENAVALRKFMELTPKSYRKMLVNLTNVVESKMCAKEWNEINFSQVPSLAAARYQKAFSRNAKEAYDKYAIELAKPEAERDSKVKINSGAVYPYDVVKSVRHGNASVANSQWNALPNFIGDSKIIPMVDVSGSMSFRLGKAGNDPLTALTALDVAVSLGLYVSEKNKSDFKDMLLTFSSHPKIDIIKGSLSQRIKQLEKQNWGFDTNLHAAFDLILDVAIKGRVQEKDMPEMLLILSDMQFNSCTRYDDSAMQMIARKYENAGYEMPKIVFWNLSPYGDTNTPVRFDSNGVCLVSGFSPAIMTSVLADDLEEFTPMNVMLKTIMAERYNY